MKTKKITDKNKIEVIKELCRQYAEDYKDDYFLYGDPTYELATDILEIIDGEVHDYE